MPGYTLTRDEIDVIGQFNQAGTIALAVATGLGGSALTLWLTILNEPGWPPFAQGMFYLLVGGTILAGLTCWWAVRAANRSKRLVLQNGD